LRKAEIIRSGLWLYISSFIVSLLGFVFWFTVSIIAGSDILGVTSAVISMYVLISSFTCLGINYGLQRFLGYYSGRGDNVSLRKCFWSIFYISIFLYGIASFTIYILSYSGYRLPNFTDDMMRITSLIIIFGISTVFQALFIGLVKTHLLLLSNLIGNILRFVVGIYLILMGWSWLGATIGYMLVPLTLIIVGLVYGFRYIGSPVKIDMGIVREVIIAGLASWIPMIIMVAGQWISVLFVYGYSSASMTGYYYIAFMVSLVVIFLGNSLAQLLLPVLSGMSDKRKETTSWIIKVGLVVMTPIAVFVALYPRLLLGLLGREYSVACPILTILIASSVPIVITTSIMNLVYAYGRYRDVAFIGLTQNIPRLILYILLVPMYGGLGSAIAFTFGGYTGLLGAIYTGLKHGFRLSFKEIAKIVIIPLVPSLAIYFLLNNWVLSLATIIIVVVIGYPRLKVLTKHDIYELSQALYFYGTAKTIYNRFKPLFDKLFIE